MLVAGGIGITPTPGLAAAIRRRGCDYTGVYPGRSLAAMPFIEHLEAANPGRVRLYPSDDGERIDADELVASVPPSGVLYVCGPTSLLTDLRRPWQIQGRPPGALRFETFGSSGTLPVQDFKVELARRGLVVDVPVGTTMLDALEAAGVEMMCYCLRGECGLCRVDVLYVDGRIDHRDVFLLSDRQRQVNREMCACVSPIAGNSVRIDC